MGAPSSPTRTAPTGAAARPKRPANLAQSDVDPSGDPDARAFGAPAADRLGEAPKDDAKLDESEDSSGALKAPGESTNPPDVHCLARTICAIKEKIRWQSPAWTEGACQRIAKDVLQSAARHHLSPTLLLAVMINESDLNENAARLTIRANKVYAKDSGLMAIRCVLDRHNHCLNGNVRGKAWEEVMNPATNIELGARELAYWRDGGASTTTLVKLRDGRGHVHTAMKRVPCRHKDHAYWAHYNHGPRYIARGYPRHYPHRVAVIDHALATVLNVDAPELHGTRITIRDVGKRERTVDRPLEARYKKLCTQIQSVRSCTTVASN
jgi:hypothetical protein